MTLRFHDLPLLNGPSATAIPSGQQPNSVSSHLTRSGLGFFLFLLHFFTFCSLVIATSIGLGVVSSVTSVKHNAKKLHFTCDLFGLKIRFWRNLCCYPTSYLILQKLHLIKISTFVVGIMEDCKENIRVWNCKRKRMVVNKTKQANKGHTVKLIKSFPVVWS